MRRRCILASLPSGCPKLTDWLCFYRRHQVENADFGDLFAIPLIAPEPEPEPEPESESSSTSPPAVAQSQEPSPEAAPPGPLKRTSPNTSAKRRRLDSEGTASSAPAQTSSSARRSSRQRPRAPDDRDPYDPDNAPTGSDEAAPAPSSTSRSRTSAQRSSARKKHTSPRSAPQSQVPTPVAAPAPAPAPAPVSVPVSAPAQSSPLSVLRVEEVGESPADAPGSGHRRRVQASGAVDSSARLQSAFQSVDGDTSPVFPQSSSPLSRKSIKSIGKNSASASSVRTGLRRSTRLSGSSDGEVNEVSADLPVVATEDVAGADVSAEIPAADESIPEVAETVIDESTGSVDAEEEEAQEVDDREAAQRLVHKRPSRRMPVPSPELSPDDASEEPVAKRPRKAPPPKKSPAQQKQPKAPRAKQNKPATERKRKKEDEAGPPIPVKIQRFTKRRRRRDDDSDDDDILNSTIPHTNRTGVNAVDFLAHTCERTIETSVNKIKEGITNSQDAAEKKELRVKLRALEAFQQELQTRFLEHVSRGVSSVADVGV